MSLASQSLLVAGREVSVRLRDRTFIFMTLFFLLLTAGTIALPALLGGDPSTVAVTQPAAADKLRGAGLEVRTVADADAAARLVRADDVDAAVVPDGGPAGVKIVAMDRAPDDVVRALSAGPPIQLLDPDAVSPMLNYLIPLAFAMIFFFTSASFGMQIAGSVTEEKQTRIVEILVAAVPARALLAGKVIAGTGLAMAQIILVAVAALVALRATGSDQLLNLLGPAIGWFLPFFVIGFLLLAAMWAAAGALVTRQEDLGASSMPVQMLVMLPFFAVIFLNDNATVMKIMSYLPFSAPIAMPIRLFKGDAAAWEPGLALLILLAAAAAFIALGARLYEGSLLRTNGRTTMRSAWREREIVAPR